jgi:hypothetical protein
VADSISGDVFHLYQFKEVPQDWWKMGCKRQLRNP